MKIRPKTVSPAASLVAGAWPCVGPDLESSQRVHPLWSQSEKLRPSHSVMRIVAHSLGLKATAGALRQKRIAFDSTPAYSRSASDATDPASLTTEDTFGEGAPVRSQQVIRQSETSGDKGPKPSV